jgi:hypothetical protein
MRRILILVTLAVALVVPASASAAVPGMTVQPGRATIAGKLFVTVPVTFTCQPADVDPDADADFDEPFLFVSIRQGIGHRLAGASGYYAIDAWNQCDGKPHAVIVTLEPDTSMVVKPGRAWLRIYANADYWSWTDEDESWVEQFADTGWIAIRLRK